MEASGKKLLAVSFTVTLLVTLFGSGCSFANQASYTPEPIDESGVSIQLKPAAQLQAAPSTTAALTPQPIEVDAMPSPYPATAADAADAPAYTDVRKQCTFAVTNNRSEFFYARDASMESAWQSYPGEQSITIDVPSSIHDITGFYFKWDSPTPSWDLYAFDSAGNQILADSGGENCGWTEFAEVPARMSEYKRFMFVATNPEIAFAISDISVYSGAIPEFVPRWKPFDGSRVDLLVIAAHPDDETVFLGAPAVTYVNDGKTVVTGYMTWGASNRRFEAEEACWMLGETYAPTLRAAHDMMANSLESMERYWPLDKAVGYIVELIRKYKPSVIITHDIGGEYGHGAHIETSLATQLAFAQTSDPMKFPESAEKYGVWKPGKLYLHMYHKDKITFDLDAPLGVFNGETVLQAVSDAFTSHTSQAAKGWKVESTGECSMENFGLFASNVGPDLKHDSMFENISLHAMDQINNTNIHPNPQ